MSADPEAKPEPSREAPSPTPTSIGLAGIPVPPLSRRSSTGLPYRHWCLAALRAGGSRPGRSGGPGDGARSVGATEAIAERESCSERSVRLTLSLACLSPTLVRAIIDGRLPRGIGIRHLADLPLSWTKQHQALGI